MRRDAGVTQVELARRLQKPQSFVSAYERGQRRIDFLEFVGIAAALEIDVETTGAELLKRVAAQASPGRTRRGGR
ncbi:MAG: helix-turn-helix transcriptional regulator [Phenylobacterium sp.]|nr:helix-turn-helix transcriptional regulator [Phenylobacterium sp.]